MQDKAAVNIQKIKAVIKGVQTDHSVIKQFVLKV